MASWAAVERLGLVIDIFGGGLFLLLGIGVLLVRPRTAASRAFSLFAIPFGIDHVVRNIYFLQDQPLGAYHFINGGLWGVAGIGLIWLLRVFPDRTSTSRPLWRGLFTAAVLLSFLHWSFLTIFIWSDFAANFAAAEGQPPGPLALAQLGNAWFTVVGHVLMWGLALKHGGDQRNDAAIRVVTIALAPYFLLSSVVLLRFAMFAQSIGASVGWAFGAVGGFVTIALWIRNSARSTDAMIRRRCRNVALGLMMVLIAGSLLMAAAPAHVEWSNLGLFGIARVVGVAVLAFMLVRYRLFDLDVRLKWTINKGSIASVFLLVFLIVGVVAENFLTTRFGWAFGGASAGILLFAIRPLERFGNSVAERALPSVRPIPDRSEAERVAMFQHMAREAWSDGNLSKAERRVLEVARQRLGLSEAAALAIENAAIR